MMSLSSKSANPVLAVTLGDPGGIGPEIAIKTVCRSDVLSIAQPTIVGSRAVAEEAISRVNPSARIRVIEPSELRDAGRSGGEVLLIDTGSAQDGDWEVGSVTAGGGRAAALDTASAVDLARSQLVDAIVSAPVNKQALRAGGEEFPGQTEYIAHLIGASEVPLTVLVGGPMRVALVTSHMSLKQAIEKIDQARVETAIRRLSQALTIGLGVDRPTIAVCGLNPHAGDNGLLGHEDQEYLVPAIAKTRDEGINAIGPLPSDALFLAGEQGSYDGIVAMYHDQGVVPLKRHGYATFAWGLPFIRTTAGHGTAYDIAGTGRANESVLVNATRLAVELANSAAQADGLRGD